MEGIVYKNTYNSPKLNKNEVLRYVGAEHCDDKTEELLFDCFCEVEKVLSYKVCYRRYPISVNGDELDLGFCRTMSHSLALCLSGCEEIVLFCATIGNGIDRLINKYSLISPSRMLMIGALGSERVESLCDDFCSSIAMEEEMLGRVIRPRFSPGYGDLPLDIQKDIFSALDPEKNLGVYLSEKLFMSPSKSVTAIVGIKKG